MTQSTHDHKPGVLLVEDDHGLAELIAEVLEDQGLVVEKATTGNLALQYLSRQVPDLIVMDYSLPDMNGSILIERVHGEIGPVPFLVITGQGSEHVAVAMMKAGASDYLVKDMSILERLPGIVLRTLEQLETSRRLAQTEAELKESQWRLSTIIDFLPDATLVIDAQGRVMAWNRAIEELTGVAAPEMLGQGDFAYAVPFYGFRCPIMIDLLMHDPSSWRESYPDVKQVGDMLVAELSFSNLHGRAVVLWGMARLLKDVNGRVIGAIETLRDITQRRHNEEEILHLNRFYRSILNGIVNGVLVTDRCDEITYANRPIQEILNKSRTSAIGLPIAEVLPAETRQTFEPLYQLAYATMQPVPFASIPLTNANGEKTFQSGWLIPMQKAGIYDGMIYTTEDITERLRSEKERAALQDQLRQAQKMESIGRLAGGVAHDFNNLLSPIIGYCDMILSEMHGEEPLLSRINAVQHAALRAKDLTRQLLGFSRKQELEIVELDLNRIIKEFQWILKRTIPEHIEIHLNLEPELGLVQADASQIEQILMNLAVNAQDAMPEGGIITIMTERVHADGSGIYDDQGLPEGEYVVLSFQDSGTGIEEHIVAHIFEPFFTTKEPGKGTGLGLANVYGIVKQHHGEIRVQSTPGQGTRFLIYFPMLSLAAGAIAKAPPITAPQHGSETVLVVEDDEIVRELVVQMLSGCGYSVLATGDPRLALEISSMHSGRIDMLLADVVMPHMNGYRLYKQLSRMRPGIKVAYMSGYSRDIIDAYRDEGEDISFIQKPFTVGAFTSTIRAVLEASTAYQG